MQMLTKDQAFTMSCLSKTPYTFYSPEYTHYGVAWQGTLMTIEHAISIACSKYLYTYPTPDTKLSLQLQFNDLYKNGFFGEQQWDEWYSEQQGENLWKLYMYRIQFHTSCTIDDMHAQVFKWLDLIAYK